MKTNYETFVFDLYGTLADIRTDEDDPARWRAFAAWLGQQGYRLEDALTLREAYRAACKDEEAAVRAREEAFGVPGPWEISLYGVWKGIVARTDWLDENERAMIGKADPEAARREAHRVQSGIEELLRTFRRMTTVRLGLYDGAAEVLRDLRARGRRVILLTNAQSQFTRPELEQLGLDGLFDRILISSEFRVKKPSPAFFAKLWETGRPGAPRRSGSRTEAGGSGPCRPGTSLMIGNDDVCDCRGAAAAGMDSLYIRTEQSPEPVGPLPENCREIRSLREILNYA